MIIGDTAEAQMTVQPQSIERTQERTNGTPYEIGIATRELLTYDRGRGSCPAGLTIEEGVAISIELLTEG